MECSIQRGRVKKLNSVALVKAVGGKWLNVSVHAPQSQWGWLSGVLGCRISFPWGSVISERTRAEERWGGGACGCHPLAWSRQG